MLRSLGPEAGGDRLACEESWMSEPRNRAGQVGRFGGPEALAVVGAPLPTAGRGEVRAGALASSRAYTDVTIRRQFYPRVRRRPPCAMGNGLAAETDQLGVFRREASRRRYKEFEP